MKPIIFVDEMKWSVYNLTVKQVAVIELFIKEYISVEYLNERGVIELSAEGDRLYLRHFSVKTGAKMLAHEIFCNKCNRSIHEGQILLHLTDSHKEDLDLEYAKFWVGRL